jgi:para-aminobenzoate synthetase/4-amino-4-deoxychorismate lyase
MAASARFDDLTPGSEHAFELIDPGEPIIADEPAEVRPALDRVAEIAAGGDQWVAGFVTYDAAPGLDPGLVVPGPSAPGQPLAWFCSFGGRRRVPVAGSGGGAGAGEYRLGGWQADMSGATHARAVSSIKRHIADGDTYQVNLTYRLRASFGGDPAGLYQDMAVAQRGGYGALIDAGRWVVASASPELFFRLRDGAIVVKPMKGTIGRGRWPEEDDERRRALASSEKDRAENIMIVDLLRNDVGRLARFGSVRADRLLDVERYETVWQLTSEVRGDVGDADIGEAFAALFPSGSVTGAPKQRTMEIITALEPSARGVYCGAVGYVAPGGAAMFSVAIRTATVDTEAGFVEYGIGGGITWDSDPAAELAEARLKADILEARPRPSHLLETMRFSPSGGIWLLDRHLQRLQSSAAYFGFAYDEASVTASLVQATEGIEEARLVRLTLSRVGEVVVEIGDALERKSLPGSASAGLVVAVGAEPVDSRDPMLFHKTTAREVYQRRSASHPDFDDVLLVNERGEVTESTVANIAARFGGTWVTPPLDSGCLPGTYRAELLDTGVLSERRLPVAEVSAADELALINSVRGWRSARVVDTPPEG